MVIYKTLDIWIRFSLKTPITTRYMTLVSHLKIFRVIYRALSTCLESYRESVIFYFPTYNLLIYSPFSPFTLLLDRSFTVKQPPAKHLLLNTLTFTNNQATYWQILVRYDHYKYRYTATRYGYIEELHGWKKAKTKSETNHLIWRIPMGQRQQVTGLGRIIWIQAHCIKFDLP